MHKHLLVVEAKHLRGRRQGCGKGLQAWFITGHHSDTAASPHRCNTASRCCMTSKPCCHSQHPRDTGSQAASPGRLSESVSPANQRSAGVCSRFVAVRLCWLTYDLAEWSAHAREQKPLIGAVPQRSLCRLLFTTRLRVHAWLRWHTWTINLCLSKPRAVTRLLTSSANCFDTCRRRLPFVLLTRGGRAW